MWNFRILSLSSPTVGLFYSVWQLSTSSKAVEKSLFFVFQKVWSSKRDWSNRKTSEKKRKIPINRLATDQLWDRSIGDVRFKIATNWSIISVPMSDWYHCTTHFFKNTRWECFMKCFRHFFCICLRYISMEKSELRFLTSCLHLPLPAQNVMEMWYIYENVLHLAYIFRKCSTFP